MPEIRKDLILPYRVIFAPERALRPQDLQITPTEDEHNFCPFCEGEEQATPDEVFAVRSDGSSANEHGWDVRVVPNRYPALQVEGELNSRPEGIYDLTNGIGAHEVIIECPQHETRLENLSVVQIESVLGAYQQRIEDLREDQRLQYVQIFKNSGAGAGATLPHCHSQLIATPFLPTTIMEKLQGAWRYYDLRERCVFCDLLYQELAEMRRVVFSSEHFVALCPYAARQPFITWIVPRDHTDNDFGALIPEKRKELANVLQETLQKLTGVLGDFPYNFMLHTAPLREPETPTFHWHLEIIPRTTQLAGFEWATGCYINTVLPEEAASLLRGYAVSNHSKSPL